MKKYRLWIAAITVLSLGFTACSDENDSQEERQDPAAIVQYITVEVESVGESLINPASEEAAVTNRTISGITSAQNFDKLALVIIDSENAQVVYKTELDNWSSTDNRTSMPYVEGKKRGRKAQLELTGDALLEDGKEYMAYAIGYQSGSYGGYIPFKDIQVGNKLTATEIARLPEGDVAEEIFAGAGLLHVNNGMVYTQASTDAPQEEAVVTLRRQVAGTFGYFTRIQATYTQDGQTYAAKYLRLVSSRANRSIIFGGFRSLEDPLNFNQENVINGYENRTDYDATLAGSTANNAFIVYSIDLARWFPDGQGGNLPLDVNGDNYLDERDSNWQMDTETYPENTLKLQTGSVFGDRFLVASAMYESDIESGLPTFQLQITDASGKVLKHWDVMLREQVMLQATRTIVSLSEDGGRPLITTGTNPETEFCYSIVRNHLYAMSDKRFDQSYGEDEPINLANATELVVDVDNEWETVGTILFH